MTSSNLCSFKVLFLGVFPLTIDAIDAHVLCLILLVVSSSPACDCSPCVCVLIHDSYKELSVCTVFTGL